MKNLSTTTNPETKSIQYYIDRLDYTLNNSCERAEFLSKLIGSDSNLETLFMQHGKQNDQSVSRGLEILADYIIMSSTDIISQSKINRFSNNTVTLDDLDKNETTAAMIGSGNCYKVVKQKITAADLTDVELKEYLIPLMRFKKHLQAQRNKAKEENNGKLKYRLDRLIGNINQDMIEIKNSIKQPISFKRVSLTTPTINWLECDYTDFEHIKELLTVSEKSLLSDLGILTYDLTQMIKNASLTKTERRIINFIRSNDSLTQAEIADEFGVTQPHISATIKSAAVKIVQYNEKNLPNKE